MRQVLKRFLSSSTKTLAQVEQKRGHASGDVGSTTRRVACANPISFGYLCHLFIRHKWTNGWSVGSVADAWAML